MANPVKQRRDFESSYHGLLNENLLLMDMVFALPSELRNILSDSMFSRPNQVAFLQISHYLVGIIDAAACKELTWPVYDKKMEAIYRREFSSFVGKIVSCEEAMVDAVMPSQYVNASGFKILKLFYQLSLLALKKLAQISGVTNFVAMTKGISVEYLQNAAETANRPVVKKMKKFNNLKTKAAAIIKIFNGAVPVLQKQNEERTDMLNKIVGECKYEDDLKNIDESSVFLIRWQRELDRFFETSQKEQNKIEELRLKAQECKQYTSLTINRYLDKDRESYTLSYNSQRDNFSVPVAILNDLTNQQQFILANIVKDGILHLPNLFRAYTIVIGHVFKSFNAFESTDVYEDSILRYNRALREVRNEFSGLSVEAKAFLQHLDEANEHRITDNQKKYVQYPPMLDLLFATDSTVLDSNSTINSYTPTNLNRIQFAINKHRAASQNSKSLAINPKSGRKQMSIASFARDMTEIKRNIQKIRQARFESTLNNVSLYSLRSNQTMYDHESTKHTERKLARLLGKDSSSRKTHEKSFSGNRRHWRQLYKDSPDDNTTMYKCKSSPNLCAPSIARSRVKLERPSQLLRLDKNEVSYDVLEVSGDAMREETPKRVVAEAAPKPARSSSLEDLIARFHSITQNKPSTVDFLNDINAENKDSGIHINVSPPHHSAIPDLLHSPNYQISTMVNAINDAQCADNRAPELLKISPNSETPCANRQSLGNHLGIDSTFLDNYSKNNDISF